MQWSLFYPQGEQGKVGDRGEKGDQGNPVSIVLILQKRDTLKLS